VGSAMGDGDVLMIASHPWLVSDTSDDELLGTGRKREASFP